MSLLSRILDGLTGRQAAAAPTRLPSPDELVLLTRPESEPEAQLDLQILLDAGIRGMVKNRDAVSAQAGGMGPAWAYELWVLRKDYQRARETLGVGDERS
jgi:hypothetical protein